MLLNAPLKLPLGEPRAVLHLPAMAKKLIDSGKIPRDSSAVICVTGNGLKMPDAMAGHVGKRVKSSRVCANSRRCWRMKKN